MKPFNPSHVIALSELSTREKEKIYSILLENDVSLRRMENGQYVCDVRLLAPGVRKIDPKEASKKAKSSSSHFPIEDRLKYLNEYGFVEVNLVDVQDFRYNTYTRFVGLISDPGDVVSPKSRLLTWTMKIIEDIYDARFIHEKHDVERDDSSSSYFSNHENYASIFPAFVVRRLATSLGLKRIVEQNCWDLLYNVHFLREEYLEVEMFARFLQEFYDQDDLLFFLYVRSVIGNMLKISFKARWSKSESTSKAQNKPFCLSYRECVLAAKNIFGAENEGMIRDFISIIIPQLVGQKTDTIDSRRIDIAQFLHLAVVGYHQAQCSQDGASFGGGNSISSSSRHSTNGSVSRLSTARNSNDLKTSSYPNEIINDLNDISYENSSPYLANDRRMNERPSYIPETMHEMDLERESLDTKLPSHPQEESWNRGDPSSIQRNVTPIVLTRDTNMPYQPSDFQADFRPIPSFPPSRYEQEPYLSSLASSFDNLQIVEENNPSSASFEIPSTSNTTSAVAVPLSRNEESHRITPKSTLESNAAEPLSRSSSPGKRTWLDETGNWEEDDEDPSIIEENTSNFDVQQGQSGDRRPSAGSVNLQSNNRRPSYGISDASYGANDGTLNDRRPSTGSVNLQSNDRRPSYGANDGTVNDRRPSTGSVNLQSNDRRPSYGANDGTVNDRRPSSRLSNIPSNDQSTIQNDNVMSNRPSLTTNPSYVDSDIAFSSSSSSSYPSSSSTMSSLFPSFPTKESTTAMPTATTPPSFPVVHTQSSDSYDASFAMMQQPPVRDAHFPTSNGYPDDNNNPYDNVTLDSSHYSHSSTMIPSFVAQENSDRNFHDLDSGYEMMMEKETPAMIAYEQDRSSGRDDTVNAWKTDVALSEHQEVADMASTMASIMASEVDTHKNLNAYANPIIMNEDQDVVSHPPSLSSSFQPLEQPQAISSAFSYPNRNLEDQESSMTPFSEEKAAAVELGGEVEEEEPSFAEGPLETPSEIPENLPTEDADAAANIADEFATIQMHRESEFLSYLCEPINSLEESIMEFVVSNLASALRQHVSEIDMHTIT